MVPATLNKLINFYCGTDDGSFPQADKIVLINVFKDDMAKEVAKRNENYFGMIYEDTLVAGNREYALPAEILNNIVGVEAKVLNSFTKWAWLSELNLNTIKAPTDETNICAYMSGRNPAFRIFRNAVILYTDTSIIDVVDGLKLHCIIYPGDIEDLTNSSVDMAVDPDEYTPGFPRQLHELLARRVAIAYKNSLDRPKTLSEKELKYDVDLQLALNAITGMNLDRITVTNPPLNTGQNY